MYLVKMVQILKILVWTPRFYRRRYLTKVKTWYAKWPKGLQIQKVLLTQTQFQEGKQLLSSMAPLESCFIERAKVTTVCCNYSNSSQTENNILPFGGGAAILQVRKTWWRSKIHWLLDKHWPTKSFVWQDKWSSCQHRSSKMRLVKTMNWTIAVADQVQER